MRGTSWTSARNRVVHPRDLPKTVVVGRVLKPHGVRGEVLVERLSDVAGRLAPGSELLIEPGSASSVDVPAAASPGGSPRAALTVVASRPHRGGMLVVFAGIDDRESAAGLRGAELAVAREQVPPAPAGTYYHFELLGCRCRDARDGDLGRVVDLLDDGGGLMLVVDDGERRLPVPFVAEFLAAIDVAAGTIDVELPLGLIEACASRS